nr:DUF2726 domain-containing protein [Micromonospora sp. DSM 115978]
MVTTGNDVGSWLRPVLTRDEYAARAATGEVFARAGCVVQPARRLGQVVQRRPPGLTGHQWSAASRTELDYVVCDAASYTPSFAVVLVDGSGDTDRVDRRTNAVCEAVGLGLLRIESSTLRRAGYGRRIVEYVLDARAFQEATRADTGSVDRPVGGVAADDASGAGGDPDWSEPAPPGYRDIVGRLPDGRQGCVNDLGTVARAAAVEAYVDRRVIDPIVRDLHVDWRDGPAEGWAWLRAAEDRFLFERVRLGQHGFSCGVEPGRLAGDLAVAAVGERLRTIDQPGPDPLTKADPLTQADLPTRADLSLRLERLRSRHDEMATPYAFAHVSFESAD